MLYLYINICNNLSNLRHNLFRPFVVSAVYGPPEYLHIVDWHYHLPFLPSCHQLLYPQYYNICSTERHNLVFVSSAEYGRKIIAIISYVVWVPWQNIGLKSHLKISEKRARNNICHVTSWGVIGDVGGRGCWRR